MLDKVLKAWECCDPFNRRCFECPYEDDCFHDNFDRVAIADMVKLLKEQKNLIDVLIEDQLRKDEEHTELLKEQQPRLLTIQEIPQFINKPVYLELWNFQTWAIITTHYGDSIKLLCREGEIKRRFDNYEKYFRLWDKEPTEEQRNAVPWKDGEQE